jgi:hypothetical protein
MSDRSDQKAKLAQELINLLKADIGARQGKPRMADEPGDTVSASHQKRDNKRLNSPVLRVNIGTSGYNTIDWSIGGLQVAEYVGTLKQYGRVKIAVSDGSPNATYYSVECRVTRVDHKKRALSLQFQALSRGMFDWLSGLQLQQTKKRA